LGRDVRAGQACQLVDQCSTILTAGQVTAVEQQVGLAIEGVAPALDRLPVFIEAGVGQPAITELQAFFIAV
jgi:hypothetical protein